ncbi:MAG: transcription termination factor Rho [Acidimicrobiales bacterium]|jgi:transcription termination factor Rho
MSGEQLERSILERKASDELRAIATAMSLEPASRVKKADLVTQILRAAGVEVDSTPANGNGHADANAFGASTSSTTSVSEGSSPEVTEPTADSSGSAAPKPRATRARAPKKAAAEPAEASTPEDGPSAAGALDSAVDGAKHDGIGDAAVAGGAGEAASEVAAPNGKRSFSPGDAATEAATETATSAATETATSAATENGSSGPQASQGSSGTQTQNRPQRDRQQYGGQGGPGNQSNQGNQGGGAGNSQGDAGNRRSRRRRGRDRERGEREPQGGGQADAPYQGELVPVKGLLDLRDEGYGFLRTSGYLPSQKDVYVSVSQARRFGLRRGDAIEGGCRPAGPSEKYPALLRIDTICGMSVEDAARRPRFEDLTPLFPDSRLRLETADDPGNVTARIVDLISPIGKGQRSMVVSPPKAGKTTILKQIAHSIEQNDKSVHLMVLLVDERPEEATDWRRSVKGEVIASTFDRPADEHTTVAELAIERAKRLVELGRDVVIILDGITRLARAYNLAQPATGRIMSGGVDSGALYPPKKFFGAARNIEEGGSLTILATALVETGSKMDEVIFEEFKGTGNHELRLDRKLAERRIYPAIDVNASSTRHEELLFDRGQLQQVWKLRRVLNALGAEGNAAAGLELLMDKIKTTKSNDEFLLEIAKAPTPQN